MSKSEEGRVGGREGWRGGAPDDAGEGKTEGAHLALESLILEEEEEEEEEQKEERGGRRGLRDLSRPDGRGGGRPR